MYCKLNLLPFVESTLVVNTSFSAIDVVQPLRVLLWAKTAEVKVGSWEGVILVPFFLTVNIAEVVVPQELSSFQRLICPE